MAETVAPAPIVAVVTDLMFTTKVIDAAKRAGRPVKFFQSPETAVEFARRGCSLLLVDLNCRDVDTVELIRRFRADPELQSIPSLGFLSHVQVQRKDEALQAGCTRIVPRSVFSDRTAQLVAETARPDPTPTAPA